MTDWRTATAPGQRRPWLPEDDLPEIDWGEASFTQGGGDEPEPEPPVIDAVAVVETQP